MSNLPPNTLKLNPSDLTPTFSSQPLNPSQPFPVPQALPSTNLNTKPSKLVPVNPVRGQPVFPKLQPVNAHVIRPDLNSMKSPAAPSYPSAKKDPSPKSPQQESRKISLSALRFSSDSVNSIENCTVQPCVVENPLGPCHEAPAKALECLIQTANIASCKSGPDMITELLGENTRIKTITETFTYCGCGKVGIHKLECLHSICANCIEMNTRCPKCESFINKYELSLPMYKCLTCKKYKVKRLGCIHYCRDCIIAQLRLSSAFECFHCPHKFVVEDVSSLNKRCSSCKTKGNYLKLAYFEVCNRHILCFACCKKSTTSRQCTACSRHLSESEVYRLRKKHRFICDNCLRSRQISKLVETNCSCLLCSFCQDVSSLCVLCGVP
jgi:hypothetical protein